MTTKNQYPIRPWDRLTDDPEWRDEVTMKTRKRKTTRTAFEAALISQYGAEDLSSLPVLESHMDLGSVMHYYADGLHVGTWRDGEGWEYVIGEGPSND